MNTAFCILIVVFDQIIKNQIRHYPIGTRLISLSPFLEIVHTCNTGAAFSLLHDNTLWVTLISTVLLLALFIYTVFFMSLTKQARTAMFCLFGGGIGNLIDRLLIGSVTDYIHLLFISFPVFNLADVVITLSIMVLILLLCTDHLENCHGVKNESNH